MRLKLNKIKKWVAASFAIILSLLPVSGMAFAEGYSITMSPMNQVIILTPGEKYAGTFTVSNDLTNTSELRYNVTVQPFFVDDNYNIKYEETEGLNQIVNWTTTDIKSGTLAVGGAQKINFTIDVPEDAPAGGQYEAIIVNSVSDKNDDKADGDTTVAMNENIAMAHIIYAEIAGTTRHSGEVLSTNVPSFIFDGNISAESTIKNTGNTHGVATYTIQVFPLFSSEEVFTNEEDPEDKTILPNRTLTNKTVWDKTPMVGIFNVKYTIEFEGVTTEVTKLVIKCPLWLFFIIIFVIIAIITWLVVRAKNRKKAEN
ncbi:hypothetical protein IJG92_01425 [Candidatus Saccharibacteria bacterium]|nr:hypothetical protein [Candidatus Saccharibacteria bacterium]